MGIDIIEIKRVKEALIRTPRLLQRLFTEQERAYCFSKKNPYPSLAARFAAREAVRKLHPAFTVGVGFHEVEVLSLADGRPELLLHGTAVERCREEGIGKLSLSLSHSQEQAIAVVIAEKG
ncbi:MAG: holo-ACP synthase [Syntrophomonas sp.]|uniref:holo-ACP synthase n=1 Tax=Syntrophomonas sp. TaxID=2053627 RepID=UPI00260BD713|nr:holo-ACP synthase [Syntrophomonas sp.]MDD3879479.1 holo-ACP synthase [Syntrophomonas sp.]MDD4625642.1 holo-ACP synthase [Syntrophomonas sp.]